MGLYEDALCEGMDIELFFDDYDHTIGPEVDSLCGECPVAKECLKMGIETAGTGVHGGIYLVLGHYSKLRNKHKTPEKIAESKEVVLKTRKQIFD